MKRSYLGLHAFPGPDRDAGRSAGGRVLLQSVDVGNEESVLPRLDDALLPPAAHDADGGLDRRGGEVDDLLPRQGNPDEDPGPLGPPRLVRERQEKACDLGADLTTFSRPRTTNQSSFAGSPSEKTLSPFS